MSISTEPLSSLHAHSQHKIVRRTEQTCSTRKFNAILLNTECERKYRFLFNVFMVICEFMTELFGSFEFFLLFFYDCLHRNGQFEFAKHM